MNKEEDPPITRELLCASHGDVLDAQGHCSTCNTISTTAETPEDKQHRILFSIARSAKHHNCHWKQVKNAEQLADAVGLSADHIESTITEIQFRHEAPLLELSHDEIQAIAKMNTTGISSWRCESGPFRHGFIISKPTTAKGNSRLDYKGSGLVRLKFDDHNNALEDNTDGYGQASDAPNAWVYPSADSKWNFTVSVYVPGPGPGDFENEHATLADAVEDIIDYYFGDPARMNPPELIEHRSKLDSYQEKTRGHSTFTCSSLLQQDFAEHQVLSFEGARKTVIARGHMVYCIHI